MTYFQLKKLMDFASPSGYEHSLIEYWLQSVNNYANITYKDVSNNGIAEYGSDEFKVMFCAHADEIGFIIHYVNDDGYLYFKTIGGWDKHILPGMRVKVYTKNGIIMGVIGRKAIHLQKDEELTKISDIHDMWIDIGAKNKPEANEKVLIGDIAIPVLNIDRMGSKNDYLIGRAIDNKAGLVILKNVIKSCSELSTYYINKLPRIYTVATVQEEIGFRGAITSSYNINPNVGIALDVTFATDHPGSSKIKHGDIVLGKGPVISRGVCFNNEIADILINCANKCDIPYQIAAENDLSGTDANALQVSRGGINTALISIPLRYMHSSSEVVNVNDIENTTKLLVQFLLEIKKYSYKFKKVLTKQ